MPRTSTRTMPGPRGDRSHEPPPVARDCRRLGERRAPGTREDLLVRVTAEYREMPGLTLTLPQARRLFGLRDDICRRVLRTLLEREVLHLTVEGFYAKR